MKQTIALAVAALVVGACAPSPEELKKAFVITSNPASRNIGPGDMLRITVDNKSGKAVEYQWSAPGDCGKLAFNPKKSFDASYVGRISDTICSESITLSVMGMHKEPLVFESKVTVRPAEKVKEIELRPNPIPDSWTMINDYNGTLTPKIIDCVRKHRGKEQEVSEEVTLNRLDATFTAWFFESSSCTIFAENDNGEQIMALDYDVATDDSYCGYTENLKLAKDCDTKLYDLSPFQALTFLARSGDTQEHHLIIEIVQWEKYAEFHQGRAAQFGPITVGKDWKRHEYAIRDICKKGPKQEVDPTFVKSVGFKVTRQGGTDKGIVFLDNVALIKENGK